VYLKKRPVAEKQGKNKAKKVMSNPNNVEHIIPYQCKPGETANPNGRPKGSRNLSTILKEYLACEDPETKTTYGEAIMMKLLKNAKAGKEKSIDMVMDRMEGKPLQKQEIKTDIRIGHEDILSDIEKGNVEGTLNADERTGEGPEGQGMAASESLQDN
jgi:hypothetical protein